jgi:hypothetical protein
MIGGLAILEDAHHNTAKLDAVPADCMEPRDEENLALVKSWMPGLPCHLEVLIVDEMGKNISGTGRKAGPCASDIRLDSEHARTRSISD